MTAQLDATPVIVAMITTGPAMIAAVAAVFVQNTRIGKRLRTVEDHTSTAAAELTPNHGSSAKDSLARLEKAVEEGQKATATALADVRADIGGIRSEIRTERTERLALAERVQTLDERKADRP